MRVLTVIGTRPEAVKMAPVLRVLKRTAGIEARLCVTAQHRELLDQILNLFGIEPDFDLDLMREDQSLPELSAAIFAKLDPVLSSFQPDWVLVQGDTTTVAITSLLAYYRRARVGHVEAGLRSFDKWQPFPEEINRRVATVIADLHFAPTDWARQNLLREGIDAGAVIVSGNPVIDALHHVASQPEPPEVHELLEPPSRPARRLVLVTAHRRENFGEPLENICRALREIARAQDVQIIYPVHPNPTVHTTVHRMLQDTPHIKLVPPLNYLTLVHLMKRATLILTDSGGIQEEASAFGVPTLVLRQVTERPEGVEAGVLKLVGTDSLRIVDEATRLLHNEAARASIELQANPYGDGHAAERIVEALLQMPPQADR
jgi:UDP-N-acetylglucosamine 2-epimerase (non-hydrolysing)